MAIYIQKEVWAASKKDRKLFEILPWTEDIDKQTIRYIQVLPTPGSLEADTNFSGKNNQQLNKRPQKKLNNDLPWVIVPRDYKR